MKKIYALSILLVILLASCSRSTTTVRNYDSVSRVESGTPVSVMLTSYSTTMVADGYEKTKLRIAVTDSASREITGAKNTIRLYIDGKGTLESQDNTPLEMKNDSTGARYTECTLDHGEYFLYFRTDTIAGKVKLEARSGKLWPGGHEIHTLPPDFYYMKPEADLLPATSKHIDRMIGADISFLPEIESRGIKFYDNGEEKDAIHILRDHGFNYIRLRIFVNPENEKGYSPGKGFCDLDHTLAMAARVKEAGMKLFLDFHYSDYWADPQQQYLPQAWLGLEYNVLADSVKEYTARVLTLLSKQGTMPDLVQIGNEINHGILWPYGDISNPDGLAGLLRAGVEGVESVDKNIPIMMHLALGGQNQEAIFWLDNMIARGVRFDLLGLSYYPRWHGTLEDLDFNLHDLATRYNKPVCVAEYSSFKKEVHDIVFSLDDDMGKGACIWEPLNRRSGLFDKDNNVTPQMNIYYELSNKYLKQPESSDK
jgi:arabinogalactan endo-1,4-beta-galactosidase